MALRVHKRSQAGHAPGVAPEHGELPFLGTAPHPRIERHRINDCLDRSIQVEWGDGLHRLGVADAPRPALAHSRLATRVSRSAGHPRGTALG